MWFGFHLRTVWGVTFTLCNFDGRLVMSVAAILAAYDWVVHPVCAAYDWVAHPVCAPCDPVSPSSTYPARQTWPGTIQYGSCTDKRLLCAKKHSHCDTHQPWPYTTTIGFISSIAPVAEGNVFNHFFLTWCPPKREPQFLTGLVVAPTNRSILLMLFIHTDTSYGHHRGTACRHNIIAREIAGVPGKQEEKSI